MTDRTNFRKKISRVLVTILLFLCIFGSVGIVRAEETEGEPIKTEAAIMEDLKSHRDGIVHIESICWNGEMEVYNTRSFTGFVVSNDMTGIYILTVNHGLTYTPEEKEKIKTENKLENNTRISEKIEVVFSGDLRVQASVVGESEQRNLTVLKLNQNVNFTNIPQFAKERVSDKEKIYLLSYPEREESEEAVYNAENVVITSGTASGYYLISDILFFKHDMQVDENSVGGPILNQDGFVVGMLLNSQMKESGAAVSSEVLKAFLDTFHVKYQEQEEFAEEKKLPVLNIVLGVVIVILLLIFVIRQIKMGAVQKKEKEPKSRKPAKNKAEKSPQASLDCISQKKRVMINKPVFVIGRDANADLVFAGSKSVSRQHASIRSDGKKFYVTDLQSTNYTFLNEKQLNPKERYGLKDGDRIRVGDEKLIFHN